MRKWWPVVLWPVTIPLYLVFLILVYFPLSIYFNWQMRRASARFLQVIRDTKDGKIPDWLVVPGRTGSAEGKSVGTNAGLPRNNDYCV